MTSPADEFVLHLADRTLWAAAAEDGWYRWSTRGLTLDDIGFLHCSTAEQLPGVVDRFYADADLAGHVVLVVDVRECAAAGSPVRWEPVGEELFPHVYGPMPAYAVVSTASPARSADGRLDLPALLAQLGKRRTSLAQ